jgi:hypothetical protein
MTLKGVSAVLVSALLWTATAVLAEPPANFSGTWELDKRESVFPPSLAMMPTGMADVTLVIDHDGTTLKIDQRLKMMAVHRSNVVTYYTDGREASNHTPRGDTVLSRSHWDGKSLVIERRGQLTRRGETENVETTDVVQLTEDGKVLVIDSTIKRAGHDGPEHSHLVYVKK